MPKNMACCLSSLNLAEYVINPYTDKAHFDFEEFAKGVCIGIRYLDHIVDINAPRHPLKEQRENSLNWRNVGLGCFGYGSALMRMGIRYGSEEAKVLTEKIFSLMFKTAVEESSRQAQKLGSFPKYNDKVWESSIIKNHFTQEQINIFRKQGLRNCSLISIAPTGSLATFLSETSGAEPEYAISFTRRTVGLTDNEDHFYKIYCKAAREYMELNKTNKLPDYFVGSSDINPMDRIDVQAIMQEHVDTAISSTINLPEYATIEEMEAIYLRAWEKGLKGLTIFRNNCKKLGILTTDNFKKEETKEKSLISNITSDLPRGSIIECCDDVIGKKRKIITGCGSLHVNAYFDPTEGSLQEIYLSKGSTGGCQNFMIGLSRMISLACRAGVDIYTIKDQLDSTGACPSYAVRSATKHDTSKGACCPMAIGNALIDMYHEMQAELDSDEDIPEPYMAITPASEKQVLPPLTKEKHEYCPECGAELIHEGSCINCHSCGWSKCS